MGKTGSGWSSRKYFDDVFMMVGPEMYGVKKWMADKTGYYIRNTGKSLITMLNDELN